MCRYFVLLDFVEQKKCCTLAVGKRKYLRNGKPTKRTTMRHDHLERELQLMLLMTENRRYTLEELCDKLEVSRRSLYYYINFFRDAGFIVEKSGGRYSLDRESPWFKKLFKTLHFTEDELLTMRRLLDGVDRNNLQVKHLRAKMEKLYDFDILDEVKTNKQVSDSISTLYDAIKYKRKVILCNYSSPHSNTTSNRVVEPFMFLNDNNEVRCYELTSKTNKTFKVSRMESVMPLMEEWENEERHRRIYTDIFMFSGEEKHTVRLRMGRLAHNLLVEEYPAAEPFITQEDKEHWLLTIEVCSFVGITRFVLGLFEHIDILGSEAFREHIKGKVKKMMHSVEF